VGEEGKVEESNRGLRRKHVAKVPATSGGGTKGRLTGVKSLHTNVLGEVQEKNLTS